MDNLINVNSSLYSKKKCSMLEEIKWELKKLRTKIILKKEEEQKDQ